LRDPSLKPFLANLFMDRLRGRFLSEEFPKWTSETISARLFQVPAQFAKWSL
jgi:hypothetical protein